MVIVSGNHTKKVSQGEYRNLQPMEDRPGLFEFEVRTASGWKLITNLGAETEADRKVFAQKTADKWRKK